MDFDNILPDVGEYGKYQKLMVWFVLLPGMIPCGFHAYNQLFMATVPKHHCHVPELEARNFTRQDIQNISIPLVETSRGWEYSSCLMYDANETNWQRNRSTMACNSGWKFYHEDPAATSVVEDWQLVCDQDFWPTAALVLFGVSGLIGNWIFGYIQDSMGRRPAFFIYLLIESVAGTATAFAPNFYAWLVFRIGVGFTIPAIMGTPLIMAIELVGPSWRTHVSLLANVVYSVALCFLAFVVWLVKDWRQMALATCLPFVSFFMYWWVLPESPRWLLSQNRLDDAEVEIRKMARINGRQLPASYFTDLKERAEVESGVKDAKPQTFGYLDLLRTPNMARKTLIVTFIWFTVTSVYVGLSYYAPALGGNEYLNFFLAGVAELPTYIFLWPTMDRWGRRWTLCLSMFIGGIACLFTLSFQHDHAVTLFLYCMGKFGISSAFVVLPLLASELYPTVVRGIGISLSSVAGMLGPIFIPLVNYLGSEQMMVLPLMIMGGLMVAGGVCALMLPETLHQHLPQTLEEGEQFGKDFGYKQWLTCCPPSAHHESEMQQIETGSEEKDGVVKPLLKETEAEDKAPVPVAELND